MERIPSKSDDRSDWYRAVCYQAELVSQAPVRGCLVPTCVPCGEPARYQAYFAQS